jgi:predicted  nucleic acid-binding Zn-ribbon protein
MLNTETEGNMRFRIRSPRRDESSDAKRLGSIERSIRNAISDIESEKDGLARRIKDARDQASVYVGSEPFEYLDREQSTEKELSASEHELVSAAKRVRQLNAHLENLHRVLEVLKQK